MWLLIDDVRDLHCDVIARTYEAAQKLLTLGDWEVICLDHDLGGEETGYDLINWMTEKDLLKCDNFQLVTDNPVGKKNMAAALISQGFITIDGTNFYR